MHSPLLWRELQDQLLTEFGAYSGPETQLRIHRAEQDVAGTWTPNDGAPAACDESRKYILALPAERVEELRAFLQRVGRSFDQRAIYLTVAGYAELVTITPEGPCL